MKATSLRGFIERYGSSYPEDVFTEQSEVDIFYEPTAYYKLMETENPLLFFTKIRKFRDFNLVTNTLGSRRRMAFAIGTEEENLYQQWDEVISNDAEPKVIEGHSPVKETLQTGDGLDLFGLPAPAHFSMDGEIKGFMRYITGGLAVARDPLNPETVNLSFTRIQIIGKDRYAFDMGSHGHLWNYVYNARKESKPMPLTILIGPHPVFYMLAASFIENEYSHASYLADFRYTPGEFNDIPIPADTEIAIEAEVMLNENFSEGPFSEFTGYMSSRSTGNVARVKSIMRKRNPIFYDIAASNSHEHVGLFSIPRNASIIRGIKQYLPPSGGYQIDWPFSSSHMVALCNVRNPEPGLSKQLGLAIIGLDALFTKIVFISEGGQKVPSLEEALLSLAGSEIIEGHNLLLIPEVFTIKLDPSSSKEGTNGKAVFLFHNSVTSFEREILENAVRITSDSKSVVFSHEENDACRVNVLVDHDIDLDNTDAVMWAIATRTRPDKDIRLNKGRLVINARSKTRLIVPELPPEIVERIKKRLNSASSIKK